MSEKLYALYDFLLDMHATGGYEEDTDALVCNHLDEFIDAGYDAESLAEMMTAEHAIKNLDKLNLKDLNCITSRINSSELLLQELDRLVSYGAKFKDLYIGVLNIKDILQNMNLIMKTGCSNEELAEYIFERHIQTVSCEYYIFTREDKVKLAVLASTNVKYSVDLLELFCQHEYCTLTDPIFRVLVSAIADSDIDKHDVNTMLAKNMGFKTYRENARWFKYLGLEFDEEAYVKQMKSEVMDWGGDCPTEDELIEILNWSNHKAIMHQLGGDFFEAIDYWNYQLYDKLDAPIYADFLDMMLEYYHKQNDAIEFWEIIDCLDKMNNSTLDLGRFNTKRMAHLYLKQSKKSGVGPYAEDLAMIKKYS